MRSGLPLELLTENIKLLKLQYRYQILGGKQKKKKELTYITMRQSTRAKF